MSTKTNDVEFIDALRECLGLDKISSCVSEPPRKQRYWLGKKLGEWIVGEYIGDNLYTITCELCGVKRRARGSHMSSGRVSKICRVHRGKKMEYAK